MTLYRQQEKEALADASHVVLQHVEGTLAAVSEKIYRLLLSANIDLSEDDIRELLGEPAVTASPQDETNTAQAPPMSILRGGQEEEEEEEEDQTAAHTASMVSTSTMENDLASSPPDPGSDTTAVETTSASDIMMLQSQVSVDNSSMSSDSNNSNDDINSVVTTETHRELKTRLGSLEHIMSTFQQEMQQLSERVEATQATERAKQEKTKHQQGDVLQAQKKAIAKLETLLELNEAELQQRTEQAQSWQERAQKVAETKGRIAAIQAEKETLQKKTEALQQKMFTVCEILLQNRTDMDSKPVLAHAVATARANQRSRAALAVPAAQKKEKPEPGSNFLRVLVIFSVVLASFMVATAIGDHRHRQLEVNGPARSTETSATVTKVHPSPSASKVSNSEMEDIPIVEALVEEILQEDEDTVDTTIIVENVGSYGGTNIMGNRRRRNVVVRILRGLKANTTKIWGRMKGIGDDIPNLVRSLD